MLRFTKGHGTGNDFVVLPDPDGELELSAELVRALCDRRQGIGADGVLRVVLTGTVPEVAKLAGEARWFMDYRNADGSPAEMCGNGVRVFARYLVECGYATDGPIPVVTRTGVREVRVDGAAISVDMGEPQLVEGPPRTVSYRGRQWPGTEVWMGNPHVVVDVGEDLDELAELGAELVAPMVSPELATNVEFVHAPRAGRVAMRVHERGVGETQSCGTGACAAAVAAASWRGERSTDAVVDVPGGRLQVRWEAGGRVTLIGPAELVAHGVLDEAWVSARAWSGVV